MTELSENLVRFLQSHVQSFPAAEVIVFIVRHAERSWTVEEVAARMTPGSPAIEAVGEHLAYYLSCGLIEETSASHFQCAIKDARDVEAVHDLLRAYDEKPVTLIRTIYELADRKIISFSNAFKFKEK